jgi:hypothetical protein
MLGELRRQRLAENEAAFRAINERSERSVERSDEISEDVTHVTCECADEQCAERVVMRAREYDFVRRSPHRFVVAPGHADCEIERVVYRHDRYWVVEKPDDA